MSLQTVLNFIKSDVEVELIPVVVGALNIIEKQPGAPGLLAAEAYVLGNAPAALIAGQTQLLQEGINDLNAELAKIQAAASAAPKP